MSTLAVSVKLFSMMENNRGPASKDRDEMAGTTSRYGPSLLFEAATYMTGDDDCDDDCEGKFVGDKGEDHPPPEPYLAPAMKAMVDELSSLAATGTPTRGSAYLTSERECLLQLPWWTEPHAINIREKAS